MKFSTILFIIITFCVNYNNIRSVVILTVLVLLVAAAVTVAVGGSISKPIQIVAVVDAGWVSATAFYGEIICKPVH